MFVSEESTAYLLEELEGVTQNIFNLFRRYDIAQVLGASELKMNEPMSKKSNIIQFRSQRSSQHDSVPYSV